MNSPPTSSNVPIPAIRAAIDGRVITPDDHDYEEARTVFYGGFDRKPAIIVRVANANDVAHVISVARESGIEMAVRSGGQSTAGHSATEGGIVLDLADMKDLEIDADGGTAWAQTGLTAGEYTTAVGARGRATGFGDTGSVGIGGITLGGGVGYLVRKYGLTIDDLLAAEVVTADGRVLDVDDDSHPDLFWAIRGGGGNFGVATKFRFRLHELSTVVGGMLILPATTEVISEFIELAANGPEELSTIANVMSAPPMPFLPVEAHGKLIVLALICYAGDTAAGERAIAPFRALATPIADMVKEMPYPGVYPPEEEGFHPIATGRTMFVDTVDGNTADTILSHLQTSTAMMSAAQLRVLGGAMARVPVEATAFAHRNSPIMINVAALYQSPQEEATHRAWVEQFAAALRQENDGAYVGFLEDEGEGRVRAAYPGATWDRLTRIKRRYDPSNLFRLNQNILPAVSAP